MSKELIVLDEIKVADVFAKGGASKIVSLIKERAESIVIDVTTAQGREDIRSLAYKIARSKTTIDNLGKGVKEEWEAKCKAIDAERKIIRDDLEALQESISKPLTDFDNKEKERVK
jgi:chaperonin cofactor prefoldin